MLLKCEALAKLGKANDIRRTAEAIKIAQTEMLGSSQGKMD